MEHSLDDPAKLAEGTRALERARALAPLISGEAEKIERTGVISASVVEAIAEADLNWVFIPEEFGGSNLRIGDAMRVAEELARADGSTGWAFMATAFGAGIAVGFLPEAGAREVFGGPDRARTAGMLLPRGTCRRVPGGYRVEGRWGFASGSQWADWIGVGFLAVDENGELVSDPGGLPPARVAFVPREQVVFEGNWNVWGLVGTGSVDYSVRDLFVPEHRTMSTFTLTPVRPEPVYRIGPFNIGLIGHCTTALGIATRALQEVAAIAPTKVRPGQTTPVGDSELFRHDFALREASLRAARLYVYHVFEEQERLAFAGAEITPEHHARGRQVTTWVQDVCAGIVDFAYRWGGSNGLRDHSALGRCVRDISAARAHLLVDPGSLVDAAVAILPGYAAAIPPGHAAAIPPGYAGNGR